MKLHWIDWSIVLLAVALVLITAIVTKRYMRSVADFLSANRCAGRYLLCVAGAMANLGAINIIAQFEVYHRVGFTAAWWSEMLVPVGLFIVISGWVTYRYRETRAMTVAQFFEIRYTKRVRVFAGGLAWFSGIINFGLFPAVGTQFFMHFCGLPDTIPGTGLSTYVVVMVGLLTIAVLFVFLGGQITVIVTDFIQGIIGNIAFLAVLAVILLMMDWSTIIETLQTTAPPDQSMINPMKGSKIESFNAFFYIIAVISSFYGVMAWQGIQAYFSSAKSAHEAKMAGILGTWRAILIVLMVMLLPIGAYVVLNNAAFADIAAMATREIDVIENDAIRSQMTVPIVLSHIMPVGVLGLFCAAMLCAFISTHDTYLHSWGSIFVQDVLVPLRKKPMTQKQHMLALRLSTLFVAIFIFIFSLLFQQNEYILMFFAITGAIWLGGAGSLITGGLYWKRATPLGAWAAMLTGLLMGVGGLAVRQTWEPMLYPWLMENTPGFMASFEAFLNGMSARVSGLNWEMSATEFPFNSQWVFFFTILVAVFLYVTLSLFESFVMKRPAFEMDRMLHRGKYAIVGEHAAGVVTPATGFRALIPTKEFTLGDRLIYFGQLAWVLTWFSLFLVGTFYALNNEIPDEIWAKFWSWKIVAVIVAGTITTVWFSIGGIVDMLRLFKTLATAKRDDRDNGTVVGHHLATDEQE